MYDQSHIDRRVEYTDRSGAKHLGTIKGVIEQAKQVDVRLDKHQGLRMYYVPFDTVRLVDLEDG